MTDSIVGFCDLVLYIAKRTLSKSIIIQRIKVYNRSLPQLSAIEHRAVQIIHGDACVFRFSKSHKSI